MYIGVLCSSAYAFFAVLEDQGTVAASDPLRRIGLSSAVPEPAAAVELVETVQSETERVAPDAVALLLPNFARPPGGPGITVAQLKGAHERGRLQALVEVGMEKAGYGATKLTQGQVRTKLKLPRSGSLQSYVGSVFPQAHAPYWANRGLAALAAEAVAR